MIRKLLLMFLLFAGFIAGNSQAQIKRVYQLSGLIVNHATHEAIPYVQVRVGNRRGGTVCNLEGFYSIPVVATDTIYFSSIGFHRTEMVVSEYLKEYQGDPNSPYVYAINYLEEDSITLGIVDIFPYNTPGKLRTAIIETDVPEDVESVNARNNMNPKVMDQLIQSLTVDEGERVMVARQMYYNQQMQSRVAPTMTLFDPLAVYRLLKYINDKAKVRKAKSLEYWND
jgi:hypothetical protein